MKDVYKKNTKRAVIGAAALAAGCAPGYVLTLDKDGRLMSFAPSDERTNERDWVFKQYGYAHEYEHQNVLATQKQAAQKEKVELESKLQNTLDAQKAEFETQLQKTTSDKSLEKQVTSSDLESLGIGAGVGVVSGLALIGLGLAVRKLYKWARK